MNNLQNAKDSYQIALQSKNEAISYPANVFDAIALQAKQGKFLLQWNRFISNKDKEILRNLGYKVFNAENSQITIVEWRLNANG